jgi:glutathione S-transferase
MKLLGSPNSPFLRKVRVVAAEKAIAVDYVVDRPSAPGSMVPTLNPLGKVPVLVLDNGEVVYDSVVIAEYFEGLKPEPRLVPADFAGRIAVKRWEALGDGVAEAVVTISHDYGPMSDPSKREAWIARQYGKIERSLASLDASVRGRDWLYGDTFTLADICAGYPLFYADKELPTFSWRGDYPALASYAERLAARPSFRATVPDAA